MLPRDAALLSEKYREMLRLRRADTEGTLPDPRPDMARLARRFPGALREIDEMPLAEIERRIEHLAAVAAGGSPEAWVWISFRYHALLRGALAHRGVQTESSDDERRAWTESPRRGSLVREVVQRLADELSLTDEEVRARLFPFARRVRR